jgi:hypothetical protein
MDPLAILYNAELRIYSRIVNYTPAEHIDLEPLVTSLHYTGQPVGALVQVVEDTSGSFAWLRFHGPTGWLNLARIDGMQAGQTVGASVDLGVHPGSGWQIAGVGNFFGRNTPSDVLWYNPSTGAVDIWQIANGNWQPASVPVHIRQGIRVPASATSMVREPATYCSIIPVTDTWMSGEFPTVTGQAASIWGCIPGISK